MNSVQVHNDTFRMETLECSDLFLIHYAHWAFKSDSARKKSEENNQLQFEFISYNNGTHYWNKLK